MNAQVAGEKGNQKNRLLDFHRYPFSKVVKDEKNYHVDMVIKLDFFVKYLGNHVTSSKYVGNCNGFKRGLGYTKT